MRVTADGKVGIGTTSPEQILHLRSASNQLRLQDSTNNKKYDLNVDLDKFMIDDMTAGVNRFAISGSNVGIGTSQPDLTLHVDGVNGYPASSGNTPVGHIAIRAKNESSTHGAHIGVANASPWGTWIQAQDAGNLATSYPLLLNPNGGNVGIGTNTPTSNLHVDGSIVSTNLAQGTGELQIQGYGATGYINMSGSGSLRFRMGSSYTEHMSLAPGGQLLASAAGRYTGLNSNSWVTFGRLYGAQSTPLNIKVIVGHNSSGGYNEFTNDTYAYNIAAGTVVTIGNTTGGYTCQIRKIKRIGGQNGIPGAHYNGGDGGWEYQVARNQAYGMSVGFHVMGATTGWTWTI